MVFQKWIVPFAIILTKHEALAHSGTSEHAERKLEVAQDLGLGKELDPLLNFIDDFRLLIESNSLVE